jgi:hypothetical protein
MKTFLTTFAAVLLAIPASAGKVAASAQRNYSDFDWRRIACNTLPLTAGHLNPRVGPSFMYLKGLSRCICALTSEISGRYNCVTEYCQVHFFDSDKRPFCIFTAFQCLGLVGDFSIALRNQNLVCHQRG